MLSNLEMLQIIGDLHRCENCLGFSQDRLSRVAPRDMCENKPLYIAGGRERCCLGRRQMAVAAGNCSIPLKEGRLYYKKIGVTHDGVKPVGGPGIADDDELIAALWRSDNVGRIDNPPIG